MIKLIKDWMVIIAILLFLGVALLAALLTKQDEPEPPAVQESGMIYVEADIR